MNSVVLILVAASGFGVAVSKKIGYNLRARELESLSMYLGYYTAKQVELDVNKTFGTYRKLVSDCLTLVKKKAVSCKACAKGASCGSGGSGSGDGNVVDHVLATIDTGATNIFNQIGQYPIDLFNNIGSTIQQFVGSSFSKIEKNFKNIGSHISSGLDDVINSFKGLDALFSGVISSTQKLFKDGISTVGGAFKDLGTYITNVVKSIEDAFKSLPIIGKRTIRKAPRIRLEMQQCNLDACPDCENVNLPDKPTSAQLAAAMSAICGDTYMKQMAAKTKVENMVNFVGVIANRSGTPIVSELIYSYDSGTKKEAVHNFTINLPGNLKTETGAAGIAMESTDIKSLAKKLVKYVYTIA